MEIVHIVFLFAYDYVCKLCCTRYVLYVCSVIKCNVLYLTFFTFHFITVRMAGVEEMSGESESDKSQYEKYVVAPSMFKAVVGTYTACIRTYCALFNSIAKYLVECDYFKEREYSSEVNVHMLFLLILFSFPPFLVFCTFPHLFFSIFSFCVFLCQLFLLSCMMDFVVFYVTNRHSFSYFVYFSTF